MSIYYKTRNKISRLIFKIVFYFSNFNFSQDNILLILGGLTGFLAGIGAIIFHESVDLIKSVFFEKIPLFLGYENILGEKSLITIIILILIPTIGGLLVGILAHYFEREDIGEGIPSVIRAVATKGGVIKGTIAVKKIIGSALSIGTGGAGGKEGPVVQIGSSIASYFGQFFSLSPDRLKILVGCGAAAGLSAAFNAPLGGALFAMEIILRTFKATTFSPILISSVFATALSRAYLGKEPAFIIPKYTMISNYELFFYIFLGLFCGLVSVYFVKIFYIIQGYFEKLHKVPRLIKPALGGLFVGILGILLPGLYGWSYTPIIDALGGSIPIVFLIALMFLKPVATALTIGSGGNGGTFAPSLITGAMAGGIFGQLINLIFPEISAQPGAYALVGMGAVVAGTTQASLTAMIMVFEMSDNYKIILPLILTIIISRTISKSILNGDLYSISFKRKGIDIDIYGRKTSVLKNIRVTSLLEQHNESIKEWFNFEKIMQIFRNSRYNSLIVIDDTNNIQGLISFSDLREVIFDEDSREISSFLVARDFMKKDFKYVFSDDNCENALSIMDSEDYEFLPVIKKDTKELLGIICRSIILDKYQKEIFLQQNNEELAV